MILSLKCHNCGATVYFDSNEIVTCCSHCGGHLKEMTEYTIKAADLNIKQQSANIDVNRERGIAEAHTKEIKTKTRSVTIILVIFLVSFLLFLLFVLILSNRFHHR